MILRSYSTAAEVAAQWKAQYCYDGRWQRDTESTHTKILAATTVEEIDKAIGNDGWTAPWCGECKDYKAPCVAFDSSCGGENFVCVDCLKAGVALIQSRDISVGGPCLPDCVICAETPILEHDLTASQHTGTPPDGIMDLCPKCLDDDPNAYHYRGDWHRKMIQERK